MRVRVPGEAPLGPRAGAWGRGEAGAGSRLDFCTLTHICTPCMLPSLGRLQDVSLSPSVAQHPTGHQALHSRHHLSREAAPEV